VVFVIPLAHGVDVFFGRRFVFLVAGFLFLIFSLPLFCWVPERKVPNPAPPSLGLFVSEWKKVFKTAATVVGKPLFLFFFLGNFFVMEAMNTVIFWLVIYLARVFAPPQIYLILLFLGLNLSAFLLGFVAGWMTDRWGAHPTFLAAAASLFATFVALGLTRNFWVFAGLSLTGGAFGLAGVWTAARKRLVDLAPPEAVGEYFGLYNLTTKISVAGSLVFSFLADRFGFQVALLSQALPSGLGLLFLWLARDVNPRNANPYPSS
jgi:UMF1 family MFS transporter